jgi:hypothetical protein
MGTWFPVVCLSLLLDVQIRDEVVAPAATLQEAREVAGRIFREIGVEVVWLSPEDARGRAAALDETRRPAFLRSLHTIRIVPAAGRGLGSATLETRQARVGYPAILRQAAATGASPGLLLGHVMAHELGHLLIGRTSHTATGLMAATLDTVRARQGRLGFSAAEREAILSRLADLLRSSIPLLRKGLPR